MSFLVYCQQYFCRHRVTIAVFRDCAYAAFPDRQDRLMNAITPPARSPQFIAESLRIGGRRVATARALEVFNPWDGALIDLAYAVPLMDTSRAASELGWSATKDAKDVLTETVHGMQDGGSDLSAVLRPRTVGGAIRRFVRDGPVSRRRQT